MAGGSGAEGDKAEHDVTAGIANPSFVVIGLTSSPGPVTATYTIYDS
jgi:hypothetical protein